MPKFKDTRKARQQQVLNGWIDDAEPKSPLADLFSRIVPVLQGLKRQRGALRFPPKPPYPEMPPVEAEAPLPSINDSVGLRAELSDTSCGERIVGPVDAGDVLRFARSVKHQLGDAFMNPTPPIVVEDDEMWAKLVAFAVEENKLMVVCFTAEWSVKISLSPPRKIPRPMATC